MPPGDPKYLTPGDFFVAGIMSELAQDDFVKPKIGCYVPFTLCLTHGAMSRFLEKGRAENGLECPYSMASRMLTCLHGGVVAWRRPASRLCCAGTLLPCFFWRLVTGQN
jgi:hypothetical protein